MQIKPAFARWFSESLLRLHAATKPKEVDRLLLRAEQELAEHERAGEVKGSVPAAMRWIRGALRLAAKNCRARIADGDSVWLGASPMARSLTRREREVVHRISLGDTDAEIGRALGISPKTASKHVENILRKLGVETRTAAAVVARASAVGP